MALTAAQKVTVAEITQEPYATIDSKASSLIAEQETVITTDIATWNENRNDVDVWLSNPSGANWKVRELLSDIRMRTRNALGFTLFSEQTHPTSGAVSNRFVF